MLSVTNVQIDKYTPRTRGVCAEATVTLDDCFVIHKVKVLSGTKGLYVGFPSIGDPFERGGKRRYSDVAHPINKSLSEVINSEVLRVYNEFAINN